MSEFGSELLFVLAIIVGSFLTLLLLIVAVEPSILRLRKSRRRMESEQRQLELRQFWEAEQKRLYPMLPTRVEKVRRGPIQEKPTWK